MKKHLLTLSIPLFVFVTSSHAVEIVSSVSDLSFSYDGGAAEHSSSAGSLSIATSKNSAAYTSFSSAYDLLEIGDTMSLSFDFSLSGTPANTSSSIDLSFSDSATPAGTGGTLWDSTFDFAVQLDPVTTGNGIQFKYGDNTNLGKFNSDQAFGVSTHTLNFIMERTGTDEMDLTFSSPTISSTARTRPSSGVTLTTSRVDTFGITFRGNAWAEQFEGAPNLATLTNFTISTTASAIPEPSSYALLTGCLGAMLVVTRRNRRP